MNPTLPLIWLSLVSMIACSDSSVGRHNAAPDVSITSHVDGDEVYEGYAVTFRGSASDADNANTDLVATWFVGGEEACSGAPGADGSTECEVTIGEGDSIVVLEVSDIEGSAGSSTVSLEVINTEIPMVSLVSPTLEGVYYVDQLVTFAAVVSDTEDQPEALSLWWESSLGDDLSNIDVAVNSAGDLSGSGFLSQGDHTISLFAQDLSGKIGSDSVVITVGGANSAPSCEITAPPNTESGGQGELVIFEALVADEDVPAEWLSVEWNSDIDGSMASSTPNTAGDVALPWSDLTVGSHVVTLSVTDEVGATCSDFVIYTVGTPPSLTIDSPLSGDLYSEGDIVTFLATVADSESSPDQVTLEWSSSLDGVISNQAPDSSGSALFAKSDLSVGEHSLTVTATDPDDLYVTAMVNFVVNGLPSAPTVTLSPDPAVTGDNIVATASGSVDPEGSSVVYSFEWYVGGLLSSASVSATLPSSATSKGESWEAVVTPTDTDGGVGATGMALIVIGNTSPVIATPVVTPSTGITTSSTLNCSATSTDADGESPAITYEWGNGSTILGTGSSLTLSSSTASPSDTITCTATATDGSGDTDSGSASVSVENTDPVVGSVAISPSSNVKVTTALVCSATATDPDGSSTTLSYSWTNGSSTLGTGSNLTLSASNSSTGDTITCSAQAVDSDGGTDTGVATVTVVNSAPVLSSAALSPTSATEVSILTCAPSSATDADGDSVSYSYNWNVAGTWNSQTADSLSGSYFNRDDSVYCVVTPNDGTTTGTSVISNTVTISNTSPSVSGVSITPSPALDNDTLTCSYSYVDVDSDSDASTIAWTVGSTAIGTGITVNSGFVAGDTVECTVTPNDGTDTGTAVSATALIGASNAAPVISSVTISPSTIYTNDTISSSVTASDADGDNITYSYVWYVDSALVAETSSSISGVTYFDRGQSVYLSVTPSDGTDTGAPVNSNTITISNTPPTAPTALISPQSPVEGIDDLICELDIASTDADGDTITYWVDWKVDTVPYSGSTSTYYTGDTVPTSDIFAQEQWECTLYADDATASSYTTDTVTVVSAEYSLTELCGSTTGGLYCGGNCTSNSSEFADAYCQIGGYSGAVSYNEISSGSVGPTWYYNENAMAAPDYLPTTCSDLGWSSYGTASYCTCIDDLVCSY